MVLSRNRFIEIHHSPMLIPGFAHIRGASDAAHQLVYQKYPVEEGWIAHEAFVVPMTNEIVGLFNSLQMFLDAGMVIESDPSEQPARLRFDGPPIPAVPESDSIQ